MIARGFEIELNETGGPVKELLSFAMIPEGLRVRVRERTAGDEPVRFAAGVAGGV